MAPLPTVLIPGLYATPRLFAAQLPALWRHGPVTVADHTRGATFAEVAATILEASPPRFALAGLSMGGALALEIVRQAPERVERLALLSSFSTPDTETAKGFRRTAVDELRAGRLDALVEASFATLVHPSRAQDTALLEIMKDMLRDTGAEAAINEVETYMNREDARPVLAAVAIPTLVLVGDSDKIVAPQHARENAAAIDGATFVEVPECGHLSALEQPDAVTAALVEWKTAA
ncbi:alpha/beta fold hydrolase [Baekduia sp. Peel2402]|uniref:alpha/beta fold hydrolase n=1 Tax=Baekduia sp. Peel2402 TaxID=3458296 RepID=UPI00403EA61E